MGILIEVHNDHYGVSETVNCASHVTRHTDKLNYNKYSDFSSTHLDYFESEIQTPKNNITIVDNSYEHNQNNRNFLLNNVKEFSGTSFHTTYRDVLITNVVDNSGRPLFYKHKTRWRSEPSISFVNENENADTGMSHKYIDGYLFNNYKNDYNFEEGSYSIVLLSGVDIDGNPRDEILNNESAISELSWRDINLGTVDGEDVLSGDGGVAKINSYVRTQEGNGYKFDVILVDGFCGEESENKIYVKFLTSNAIFLKKPENINQNDSWFLRINNGFFFAGKKYFVPEYDYQNFNPEYGILKSYDKECYILNKFNNGSVLKTSTSNLLLDKELGLHITVKILDSSETLQRIFTSDLSLVGNAHSSGVLYEAGVTSVDSTDGVIILGTDIYANPSKAFDEEIKIRADYHSKAEDFIYQKLDLNPIYNSDFLEYKYFFYLKPDMDFKESIYWIKLNFRNVVKETSDLENESNVLNLTLDEFKTNYTYGFNNSFDYLPLGEVLYQETSYIDEAQIIDIKDSTPVNEETFEDYVSRQHRVLQSDFGYGDEGQVYQDSNIIYVTLPKTLLESYGGSYTEAELYDLLKLKTSPGLEIIFNWEDKKPTLTIDALTNDEIQAQEDRNENWIRVKSSLEGVGVYTLLRASELNLFNVEGGVVVLETIEVGADLLSQGKTIEIKDTTVEYNKKYFYKIVYNDIYESDIVGVKTREEQGA